MGLRGLFLICLLLTSASARSEILYARPDGDAASGPDPSGRIRRSRTQSPSRRRSPWQGRPAARGRLKSDSSPARDGGDDLSLDLGSTGAALRWRGSTANKLTLRGQVDRSGSSPRPLPPLSGAIAATDPVRAPRGGPVCCAPSDGPPDKRKDLLDYLSGELVETVIDNGADGENP